jgi:uncharacterized RDD family membrane protein YckC
MRAFAERVRRWPVLVGLIALCAMFAAPSRGDAAPGEPMAIPAAGAMLDTALPIELRSAHAWTVIYDGNGTDGVLMHLPPRDPANKVRSGVMRAVTPLRDRPLFMAAVGPRLYMAWPQRVHWLSAEAMPGVGNWDYRNASDLGTCPALPKGAVVRDLAATPAGPVVLLSGVSDAQRLLALGGTQWNALAMPAGVGDARVWLAQAPGGLWLVALNGEANELRIWQCTLGEVGPTPAIADSEASAPMPGTEIGVISARWIEQAPTPIARELSSQLTHARLISTGRTLALATSASKSKLTLWSLEPGSVRELATLDGVGERNSVFPIAGPDVACVVWVSEAPSKGPGRTPVGDAKVEPIAPQRVEVREVSLRSGRIMFAGNQAGPSGPLSSGDFHLLTLLMGCAIAAVLLFVMRTEQKFQPVLPTGASLAHPGKRLAAWILDFVPAVILAGAVFARSPGQVITGLAMHESMVEAIPFAVALLIALTHSALMEHTSGASLGKMMLGLGVIAYQRRAPANAGEATGSLAITRPTLAQALVRNAIRWLLFPLGATILFDPNTRHAGDMLARTLVVQPPSEEPAPRDDDEA